IAMTGPTSDVDYGTVDGQTQLTIVNATHPLAAGLSGTVGVAVDPIKMRWGLPGANAITIATAVGQPTRATVFACEQGVTMADGTTLAPARRGGLFVWPRYLNLAGWGLFDAAVPRAPAPPVPRLFRVNHHRDATTR